MTSTPPSPPPAGPSALDGFFDSLRRMNTPRSEQRWIGGVAGGIAARLGIDPLIVRGVFLVITLFGGLGLLVYGLAWALLPEASDGRIHTQEAIRGRFDAALVGAIVFAVIGLSRVGFWWDGWFGIPYMIGMVALVALVIVVIAAVRGSSRSSRPTAQPGQGGSVPYSGGSGSATGAQSAPAQQPAPGQAANGPWAGGQWPDEATGSGAPGGTADSGPWPGEAASSGEPEFPAPDTAAGHPAESGPAAESAAAPGATAAAGAGSWPAAEESWTAAPGGAPPTTAAPGYPPPSPPAPITAPPAKPPRPPKPTRQGPGRVLVRLTFGLALLATAGLSLAHLLAGWPGVPWLVALGGALVILGLGATVAGLLGRRSASLGVIGTLLAIVLVPWAITANMFSGYTFTDASSYGDRYWAPQTADEAAEGYSLAAGSIEVDLSNLTDDTITTPIDVDLAAGDVVLLVPDELPVTVTAQVQGEATAVNLSDWTAEVNGDHHTLADRTDLGWRLGTTPLTVDLSSPEAASTTPVQVNLDVAFGTIEVRELP